VLLAISELTNTDLHWILTGKSGSMANAPKKTTNNPLIAKISGLIEKEPALSAAINSFVDFLVEKNQIELDLKTKKQAKKSAKSPCWLPILGRTAAGLARFWTETEDKLPNITDLTDIIRKYQNKKNNNWHTKPISDDHSFSCLSSLDKTSVCFVQVSDDTDGICEFIESPAIYNSYPDAFALRVDGDSMAPNFQDGDLIIVSPSVPAGDGTLSVVKLRDQIGVTCKIIRFDANHIHLIPTNEHYDTKIYHRDQLIWSLAVLWRIRLS
jgi:hypothetical protein